MLGVWFTALVKDSRQDGVFLELVQNLRSKKKKKLPVSVFCALFWCVCCPPFYIIFRKWVNPI